MDVTGKDKKITKQTNKNALVEEEEEDKLEIIHGRDVFHVILRRRRRYAHRAPPYDAYTHIYFYGCR